MKAAQWIIFLAAMIIFSVFLSRVAGKYDENPIPTEELSRKPKKKMEFRSKNSLYIINVMDKEKRVYFSFSKGRTVDIQDQSGLDWDISFHRVNFVSNGGITNSKGDVGIINLGPVDINSIETAPETGYKEDSGWFGLNLNKELNKWYRYSTRDHDVTSRQDVHVIRTVDGKYAKMKILYYYCEGGISGCLAIEYFYQPDGTGNLKNPNETINIMENKL